MTIAHSGRPADDMDCDEGKEEKAPYSEETNLQPSAVSVFLRVRPLSTIEHANPSAKSVVQCLKDGIVVSGSQKSSDSRFYGARNAVPRPQHFKVDQVFHPHDTQIEVYAACRPIVTACLEGINGSILAYGATGSGKTHSMFGGGMSAAGVVYQAVQDILEAKERLEMEEHKVVTLRCSFLEVYNEEVYDLLAPVAPRGKRTALHLRDLSNDDDELSPTGVNPETITVKGLTQVTASTGEEFSKCVGRGHMNRFTASTNANAHSSRSHAILTVEVEVQDTMDPSLGTMGRIRFCDLAGSERAAGTSNSGVRLREGGNINRSLLALSAVVQALGQAKKHPKRNRYVPYRGSKLTRVLRDCLGGNCRTLMLFCVSPSSLNYDETINTMLFAIQVKEIQVHAKRHELRVDPKEVAKSQELLIEELRSELAATREELQRLRAAGSGRLTVAHSATQGPNEPAPKKPVAGDSPSLNSSVGYGGKGPRPLSTPDVPAFPVTEVNECGAEETRPVTTRGMSVDSPKRNSSTLLFPRSCSRPGISDTYTDLQVKLNTLSVKKEAYYRGMKEAQEKSSELDVRLRQQTWKLAHFLLSHSNKALAMQGIDSSSNGNGNRLSAAANGIVGDIGSTAPVGVARLWHTVEHMRKENAARGDEMDRLLENMNETDRAISSVQEELLRERQHPMLELLLDNVRLRHSCTEAECLAAHYHQKCRAAENREEEYKQALIICTSSIRRTTPLINSVALREEGQRAVTYAKLPLIGTDGMIAMCHRSMRSLSLQSGTPASSLLSHASPDLLSPKADRTKGLNGHKAPTGAAAPPPSSSSSLLLLGPAEKNGSSKPKAKGTAHAAPHPFARSYTTTALRPNGADRPATAPVTTKAPTATTKTPTTTKAPTAAKTPKAAKTRRTAAAAAAAAAAPSSSSSRHAKPKSPAGAAAPFSRSRSDLGPRPARAKESRGAREADGARPQPQPRTTAKRALSSYARSRTAAQVPRSPKGNKEPARLQRCATVMKSCEGSEGGSGTYKVRPAKNARVAFLLSSADGESGAPKLQHTDLEARFAELRAEMKHWQEGKH